MGPLGHTARSTFVDVRGSAANAEILNARPPLLPQLCLGGDQTLHKLWWSGCKRFKSGHGIVGEVSGVEAVIHCGDELWFGVGMKVSEGVWL